MAWSEAVWEEAARLGPVELGPETQAQGLDVVRRPVFICGVHRSGTTLVRDLLDDHPALGVLPSEGNFFKTFEPKLIGRSSQEALGVIGRDWLRRLATSINQPPFWLLGSSTPAASPYVAFARGCMAWWPFLESRLAPTVRSWPLASIVLAYVACRNESRIPPRMLRWVEKTPTNEQSMDRLWAEFPEAKVVHVVREPASTFASHRKLGSTGWFRRRHRILRDLACSYRIAAQRAGSENEDRYLLVRYEELIEDAPRVTSELARFLGIEPLPSLLLPTVAGLPASPNSSFVGSGSRGLIVPGSERASGSLDPWDRGLMAVMVGEAAARLGYVVREPTGARRLLLRLASHVQ